jgi:hypothetical protein
MILAPLAGLSMVFAIATGPMTESTEHGAPRSNQQKAAAVQPLVRSATECIARSIAADQRFGQQANAGEFGDLIVDSMPACTQPVRAMIDAYDRAFGNGSGEAFFMGPYLDILPTAVSKWVKEYNR